MFPAVRWLIGQYGRSAVEMASEKVLGFPAVMVDRLGEANQIRDSLK